MSSAANDRIIAATLTLMANHGVAGLTMSAIATEAGVARQTLYNHFPDVEAIIYAATSAHQKESIEHLTQVLSTIEAPEARLEHLVRHSAALAAHSHPAVRGAFSSTIAELIAAHDRETHLLIATALQDGIDRNEFRSDLDVQSDALLLQRMIEGVGELVARSPADAADIVTSAVRSVLGAVRH